MLLALAGVWIWAGSEGSLATALRWAGAAQPLVTDEVTGNLRSAGKVRRLVWEQGGLRVEVHDAEIRWTPAALLARTLRIDHLGASRIEIDDQRPKSQEPAAGPPPSVALPIKLQVKELAAGELRWAGPPPYSMQDVAGRFDYDGARHLLELDRARVEGGLYRARAAVTAHAPVSLELALAGALAAPVPGAESPVPLTVQATLHGPLSELRAQADVRADPAARAASAPAEPQAPALPDPRAPAAAPAAGDADLPEAHASARITPWAAQPLPEAHARVRALDLGALWAEAPHTRLTGQFDLAPLPAGAAPGWAVKADLANAEPGPWDQRRLPLASLRADVDWAGGAADVRALTAQLGGGTLESSGRWAGTAGGWKIDTRINAVNPAALHTQLAAFPVDGTAQVSGAGSAIDFDAALQARAQRADPPRRAGETAAQALARDLRALRLKDAQATGRWDQGLLTLSRLRVRTDEAELAGQARVHPAAPGGSADLSFTAPGATLALKGEAQPASGAGTLRADVQDAARLLAWARKLPGAADALAGAQARGRATLTADWRGGWRDPQLQARLAVPQLDVQPPGDGAPPLQARNLALNLAGKLAQAQIDASGRVAQGDRQLDLRLAASGGRTTPSAPQARSTTTAPLAQSAWRLTLGTVQAGVRDPALGEGTWQLATRAAVPLAWSPQGGGQFDAGAGELTLTSPAPVSQAVVVWGPARWHGGELTTTGRLTGLPLEWVERLAGTRLADAGLTGNVVFDGGWDAALGRALRVSAHLARASGDLTVLATDAQTGLQSRVAAGLREARVALTSSGQALNLQVKWDSTRAGTVDGALRTELSATPSAEGRTRWAWPESAPLQGHLQARLPQISAWSVLAPPGWRLRGALEADARIGGTRAAPLVGGTLAADELALRSVADGLQFGGGRLRARLDGTRLLVDEFLLRGAGREGAGGTLRATGEAGWVDGRARARLDATLDQLRASIRDDRQLTVSGSVQAALDGRAVQAGGRLRVDRARIVLPEESAPSLGSDVIVRGAGGQVGTGKEAPGAVARPTSAAGQQAAAAEKRAEQREAEASPLSVAASVQIDLGEDFRVQGLGVDTRLAGTLTLAANGPITTLPQLTGTVRTVDGTVRAYSQQLQISRGNIVFSGDAGNPTLDIIALRPNYASDQRVGAQVQGTALLPRIRLYSQPALPDNEALAWLLLGRAAPSTGAEAAMLQSAALALLGGREGRGLASRFGLDELSFAGAESGTLAGASVTLGKRLSERLYAAYEHSLSGASGTLLIFYELSRRWTLRGQAGENAAVDLIYRLSFD
ncbi:MAG: translocation/assembly module TamB domain-containing protein [Ottowia sp.]|uniref:translocation/assembly module TamB domain-containing protein n=1 Tax=Ottowia sp. TaxID=1898956 RepID=UPI0039E3D13B